MKYRLGKQEPFVYSFIVFFKQYIEADKHVVDSAHAGGC